MDKYGLLDKNYHDLRKSTMSLSYRLKRRTIEVIGCINKYFSKDELNMIDLGAADGLMLSMIKDYYSLGKCIGIEYSRELIETFNDNRFEILQADVNYLPIPDNSFDIAIATAIIEHLPEPEKMLEEVKRILKPGGLLILTCPDPFWEYIATFVGHLSDEQHHEVMNIKGLVELFKKIGFQIVETKKFMLSPIGMPLEITIENIIRKIGLNFLFANQLVVGRVG